MKNFQSLIISLFLSSFIFSQVSLSIDNVTDNGLSIMMENTVDVGGFLFDLTGVTISDASGGSAQDNGFLISTSTTTILGFSLTGAVIPPGNGALLNVTFSDPGAEICLSDVVISDQTGNSIDVSVGDCWSEPEIISGCTDDSACNYNPDAEDDDGSCAYEFDCAGECGGDAVVDECGECGGDGIGDGYCDCDDSIEDCAGDCGGNAIEDCAGECNGDAVEDVCGECNGGETDPSECVQDGFSLSLSNVNPSSGTLSVVMNNESNVGGFQFNLRSYY